MFFDDRIKNDFPFFTHHPEIAYLDSASSALKPTRVIDTVRQYNERYGVNVHRGMYDLSAEATTLFENARGEIARFINANPDEIIITSGATHGLNMLAYRLGDTLRPKDVIVLSRMEHHANIIPWQEAAKRTGAVLRFIELIQDYTIDEASVESAIDERTKIVSVTMASNALGTLSPLQAIVARAKAVGAITVIDAAQGIAHIPVNVKTMDCDFLVFSGHKLYGPTGVGVLYGKKERLERLEPFFFGGEMIRSVSYEMAEWAGLPQKFEAGTPPITGVIGLAEAIRYLSSLGWGAIEHHEKELTRYALETIGRHARIVGQATAADRIGVISFVMDGIHPHDIAEILNRDGIAVRAGHHCAMPLMRHLGLAGTVRVSLGVYNTKAEIEQVGEAVWKVRDLFHA